MQNKPALPLRILAVLISLLALVALLFGSLRHILTRTDVFRDIYSSLNHASRMGMDAEELVRASKQMIDYMEGSANSIDIEVTVYGERTQMFNERERLHMVDVRVLYQNWRTAAYIFMGCYVALAAFFVWRYKKEAPYRLSRAFLCASGVFLLIGVLLGSWILVDFNSFWTMFHHVFFDNDLWLLDPATSRMINMMPLELFFGIVVRMAGRFLTAWGALCVLGFAVTRLPGYRHLRKARARR